jgi:hypothetical protein
MTLPPFFKFERQGNKEKIVDVSRLKYAKKREEIEEKIGKWGRDYKESKENKQTQLSFKIPGH